MRMSTAVPDIECICISDSDSESISLPAAMPALAAATAQSRSRRSALQAVAGSQRVGAKQARPVPAAPASRSPLSFTQTCTGNHPPTAKNVKRPASVAVPPPALGPAHLSNSVPCPSGMSRALEIVGGRAQMTMKYFRHVFGKLCHPPVAANVRVEQGYLQLTSFVSVTVSGGCDNGCSTSTLCVEGLLEDLLRGKRLVRWSLHSRAAREGQIPHGQPSFEHVYLVMHVAETPEAIHMRVDAAAGCSQDLVPHGRKRTGSEAAHARHGNTASSSVQTTHSPHTCTAPANAYVPVAAAARFRTPVAPVPLQGTHAAAGQAAVRQTCTAAVRAPTAAAPKAPVAGPVSSVAPPAAAAGQVAVGLASAAVISSPTPATTSAAVAIITLADEPAIQQTAPVWRSMPSPATSEAAMSKASMPQHAAAAEPEAYASEASMPEPSLPEACKREAFTPEPSLPKASSPKDSFREASKHEASTPEAATRKACKQEASSPEVPHKVRHEIFKPFAYLPEALTPEVLRSRASTPKNPTPEASHVLQPDTTETPTPAATMPEATFLEGSTPEASLPHAAIPAKAQLAIAPGSVAPMTPAPAAMPACAAATALVGAGTPKSPATAKAGAQAPKPLCGKGQTVKVPKKHDHIIRKTVTVPKKFVTKHFSGAVFPVAVGLCVRLNGVSDTVVHAVQVQGGKGSHRLLKVPKLLRSKRLLRFVYVSETLIELHIEDVPQVEAASAPSSPPLLAAATGSSGPVVENSGHSPAGAPVTKRTLPAATPSADEVAPLAETCTRASLSNKKRRKATKQVVQEPVQAEATLPATLVAQSAPAAMAPAAASSPKPAKKPRLLSTADPVSLAAAALSIAGSGNEAAGGVSGEVNIDSAGMELDHGATACVVQPAAVTEVPETISLSSTEDAQELERQRQKLERKLQRRMSRQQETDAAATAAREAAVRAEAEEACELEAQRLAEERAEAILAEERAEEILAEQKAARKKAKSDRKRRVKEEAAQVAEETAAAAAAEAALLAEPERAPLPASVMKAEQQTGGEHPSGEALSGMGMLLAQLLTLVQAPGDVRAQALTNLRLLHGADSFVTVIYPMLVAESQKGRFGLCKHHMLNWLEANSRGLPKVSKDQAMQLVPGYSPAEASEGKMAEVVTQAVSLLGMSSKVARTANLRAQAALSHLRGHDRMFTHSAGHAFLCEAISRQDAIALPHILDQLLNMQLVPRIF